MTDRRIVLGFEDFDDDPPKRGATDAFGRPVVPRAAPAEPPADPRADDDPPTRPGALRPRDATEPVPAGRESPSAGFARPVSGSGGPPPSSPGLGMPSSGPGLGTPPTGPPPAGPGYGPPPSAPPPGGQPYGPPPSGPPPGGSPYGPPPGFAPGPAPGAWAPVALVAPAPPGGAVVSLVLGIVGLVVCGLLCSVPAIVFGHIAMSQSAALPGRPGHGMALAGTILGWIGTLIWVIVLAVILGGV
ncbi:DUF4190 domain-containing protein [Patulibacter sp. NPDC049589]|uniref:DUF4190 domain-containing protein n=1 Tax=Patulibacter sp. NPDC049589 TaxID=3154731 RepID=UPI0034450196